jgi:hypothetical protein
MELGELLHRMFQDCVNVHRELSLILMAVLPGPYVRIAVEAGDADVFRFAAGAQPCIILISRNNIPMVDRPLIRASSQYLSTESCFH